LNGAKALALKDAMSRPKRSGARMLTFAACSGVIVAMAAFTVYRYTASPTEPLTTASVSRSEANAGTVLVPDGEGACHKYIYGNDTGKSTYTGITSCDTSKPKDTRANLPPALRGMQDSLRTR
jgi:hypothetical protein